MKTANGNVTDEQTIENEDGAEDEEWEGIEQEPEPIDHEEEYIDEDKYTTVTVESVGIAKHGFRKISEDGVTEEDNESGEELERKEEGKNKKNWTKEKPKSDRPKKKKKKFRYESKADRKITRLKERSKGRKAALARKGK